MKKIIFGITSLQIGGAERVLIDLANKLYDKFDITIFTIYDNGKLKEQVNKNVKIISMYDRPYEQFSKIQRIKISIKLFFYDKPLKGYDTYIAFLEGPITRLFSKAKTSYNMKNNVETNSEGSVKEMQNSKNSFRVNGVKKIAWVHNDVSKAFGSGIKSKIKNMLDKKAYKKYDKIIFVSKENQDDFNKLYGNDFDEEIIRNYMDYESIIEKSKEKIDDFTTEEATKKKIDDFTTEETTKEKIKGLTKTNTKENEENRLFKEQQVGDLKSSNKDAGEFKASEFDKNNGPIFITSCRLVEQKALDRFIRVHKKLIDNGYKNKVFVLGEGPLREKLQTQVNQSDVNESFIFLGAKTNPYPYIKKADYFCLFSYYEGYGMVLEEAKILNKRILITNTAAVECVENYKKAQVFENTENGIYEGLKQIIENRNYINDNIEQKNWQEYYKNILKQVSEIL